MKIISQVEFIAKQIVNDFQHAIDSIDNINQLENHPMYPLIEDTDKVLFGGYRQKIQLLYQPVKSFLDGTLTASEAAPIVKGYYLASVDYMKVLRKYNKIGLTEEELNFLLQHAFESIQSTPHHVFEKALIKSKRKLEQKVAEFEKVW